MHNSRTRNRDAGFTLIEIMVVILILGLLATVVGPAVLGQSETAKIEKAKSDVLKIHETAELFSIQNKGRVPTMEELVTPDSRTGDTYLRGYTTVPRDPWDNEYRIVAGERRGKFEVQSNGPDGQEGTEDDITNMTARNEQPK